MIIIIGYKVSFLRKIYNCIMDLDCNSSSGKEKVSTNNQDGLTNIVCIPTNDYWDYMSSLSAPYCLVRATSKTKVPDLGLVLWLTFKNRNTSFSFLPHVPLKQTFFLFYLLYLNFKICPLLQKLCRFWQLCLV